MNMRTKPFTNKIKKKQFSAIYDNGDFIYIATYSGDSSSMRDPLGPEYYLAANATKEEIGAALMDCLSHSRFLPHEENESFYDLDARNFSVEAWIRFMMEKYKYKSKRALLSGMDVCSVEQFDGKIVIGPRCHVAPLIWVRRTTDQFEDVVIPDTSSPGEIGMAVKLGISRCTTE